MTEQKKKLTAADLLALSSKSKQDKKTKLVPAKPAVLSKPVAINHGRVVNYYVEYEDGTVHLAQGDHAHLIYRFTLESQKLATMHAFAYYEGPAMLEITKDEAIELMTIKKDLDLEDSKDGK